MLTGRCTLGVVITADLRSGDDIMELLMVTDALRRLPGGRSAAIHLVVPYLPYARQDRVCNPGEALGLRVMCDLINAQGYASVEVWDAHSDVALALLDRVIHVEAWRFVSAFYDPNMVMVAPDEGAVKRTHRCAQEVLADVVHAEKIRDTLTGEITGTEVHSQGVGSRDFLIVDDICDGGRTFIELAKKLRPLTTGKIYLYVTHAIMSKGLDVMRPFLDGIYTANSWVEDTSGFLRVVTIPSTVYTKEY